MSTTTSGDKTPSPTTASVERLREEWMERERAASEALERADAIAAETGEDTTLDAAGWAAVTAAQKARLAYHAQKSVVRARAREADAAAAAAAAKDSDDDADDNDDDDNDDDDVVEVTTRVGQMQVRRKKRENGNGFRGGAKAFLQRVNRDVLAFVNSGDHHGMLPPMERMQRGCARRLAAVHGVVTKEIGSGGVRKPLLLERTEQTCEAPSSKVTAIIAEISQQHECDSSPSPSPSPARDTTTAKREKAKKLRRRHSEPSTTTTTSTTRTRRKQQVVGAGADPLWEDSGNVGNQLLRKLGWTPGNGIGAQEQGVQEPLCAVVKHNRHGLGSAH